MMMYIFCVFTGNIATAVLQEAAEITVDPELLNRETTYTDTNIRSETEDRQIENLQKERAEAEVAQVGKRNEDGEREKKETKEKKESLPEESLKMTSWVEVEDERLGAEADSALQAEEGREGAEEQLLLEVEGRSSAEKEQTCSVEEELAMMEEKWREQCAINETLKQRLANEEERFRVRHTPTDHRVRQHDHI